jgi:hypothetical protein
VHDQRADGGDEFEEQDATKAWDRGLQRLDVIRLGLDEYMKRYMHCWDVADMNEAQRAQLRPSMAAAIQGTPQLPHDLSPMLSP